MGNLCKIFTIFSLSFVMLTCSYVNNNKKVLIDITNKTNKPIRLKAKAGFIGKNITIKSGKTWKGWIPSFWIPEKVEIEIHDGEKKK